VGQEDSGATGLWDSRDVGQRDRRIAGRRAVEQKDNGAMGRE
jgi:hypothetical protein